MNITKEELEQFVNENFESRPFWYNPQDGFIAIQAGNGNSAKIEDLHYEYNNGVVRFHIEGNNWWHFRNKLQNKLKCIPELEGAYWQKRQNCQWTVTDKNEVFSAFKKLKDIIDPIINGEETAFDTEEEVSLDDNSLDIYDKNLYIPDYQRIYAWQPEQVKTLIDDLINFDLSQYHIGTIILHKNNDRYDVVDGQQRLVTIALLLHFLSKDEVSGNGLGKGVENFLNCTYNSSEALYNIYNNYQFIERYAKEKVDKLKAKIEKIHFSVLNINGNDNLDLAFTFFSTINSRGKKLTDYDLLKPHHLRFIPSDLVKQQEHLSIKWDAMINEGRKNFNGNNKDIDYIRVFELCLFRLRNWSRFEDCNYGIDHFIKKEFECAATIPEIPPFGERFDYYEPIQGGQHFFAYVDHFTEAYKNFHIKKDILKFFGHNCFGYDKSLSWHGNVIEALSFCFYTKFGEVYLNEATMSIARYVASIRFQMKSAREKTILDWAKNSKITIMINQSTSPTFFLAYMEQLLDSLCVEEEYDKGIRQRFYIQCKQFSEELAKRASVKYYQKEFNKLRY